MLQGQLFLAVLLLLRCVADKEVCGDNTKIECSGSDANMSEVLQFVDKTALSTEVGQRVMMAQREAIAARGKFVIALSGGSLPKLLAQGLLDHAEKIQWDAWHVFFADERYVPLGHEDSNLQACKQAFLDNDLVRIPASQIYGLDYTLPLEDSAASYQAKLIEVAGSEPSTQPPQIDLVMLGMGPDGHTCSLFPGHFLLEEQSKWVASIADSPKPPPERITLTLPVLNTAKQVFFLATGGSKADVLPLVTCSAANLIAQGDEALPAARVRPNSGNLVWFIDADAGAKL